MPYADPYGSPAASGGSVPASADPSGDPEGYFKYYLNNTPEAGFWYYLQKHGMVGTNPNQQYAQNQYNKTYGGYMANAADNPNEGFYDYLNRTNKDYGSDFANQTPDQRGDFTGRTLTGHARFMKAY